MKSFLSRASVALALLTLNACGGCTEDPPPNNDSGPEPLCALPVEGTITLGTAVTGTLSGDSANVSTSCTPDQGTNGPEHFYELVLEEETIIRATLTSENADVAVALRADCEDALSESLCGLETNNAITTVPAGTWFVLVDTLAFGVGGDYELLLEAVEELPNTTCDNALAIDVFPAQFTLDPAEGGAAPNCEPNVPEEERAFFFELTVPGESALVVESISGPNDIRVIELSSCGNTPADCVGDQFNRGGFVNPAADAATVVLAIQMPNFNLDPRTIGFSVVPLPRNGLCEDAIAVEDGDVETGVLGVAPGEPIDCGNGPILNQPLFYSASVPAGETLIAAVSTGGPPPLVAILPDCTAATCLDVPEFPGPGRSIASFTNTGNAARDVLIAVGSDISEISPFELTVRIVPPAENTSCDAPLAVTNGDQLSLQPVRDGVADLSSSCLANQRRGALFYSATIPDGEELIAAASGGELVLRLLDGCGGFAPLPDAGVPGPVDAGLVDGGVDAGAVDGGVADGGVEDAGPVTPPEPELIPPTCLASVAPGNVPGPGGRNVLRFTNDTGADLDVILAVSAANVQFGEVAEFADLAIAIGATPYVQETVAQACADLSAGTPVPGATGDDATSSPIELPFALDYFGAEVTHFAADTNGYLELGGAGLLPRSVFGNQPLPAAELGGMIAAYWDDLRVDPPAVVRTLTEGAEGSRVFIVEFSEVTPFNQADQGSNITFQVKLFEADDAIELHYCEINGATLDGDSATIGIQDTLGARSVQASFDTSGAIDTTDAIRFVAQ